MSELSPLELEGRLNGQRELLGLLLEAALRRDDGELARRLEEWSALSDHQEDPGAVPQAAFAVEAAERREIELIVEAARSKLSQEDGTSPSGSGSSAIRGEADG